MTDAILITGVPGTGKTTLMKNIIHETGGFDAYDDVCLKQLVPSLHHRDNQHHILGIYNDDPSEVFQGTDRMSMAVMPKFKEFVNEHRPNMLIEGDRLVGQSTIDFLIENQYNILLYVLNVNDANILQERYDARGSNQPEKFLKAKHTKVNNLRSRLDLILESRIKEVDNNTYDDMKFITEDILDKIL